MRSRADTLLTEEDRKLLSDTRRLLNELLETLDILSNPREVRGIRQALKEAEEGNVRSWDEFEKELNGERKP